jgi:hypothetical protein
MLPRANAVKSALILVNRAGCLNKTNQGCKSNKERNNRKRKKKENKTKDQE